MKVVQFALDVNYVNVFLAYHDESKEAFLVDCGGFDAGIQEFIESNGLALKFLLLTHTHYDHVDGLAGFKKLYDLPVYCFDQTYGQQVQEGDRIQFGESEIAVFETPGHIADGVSYFIGTAVFVGDAIFAGAVGGTSDRKHFEQEINHVREKILQLPDATVIYSGHGAPSVVGVERLYNPFFH